MQPGRNAKKRRKLIAPAMLLLFTGAAVLAAGPAQALGLLGEGSGSADALFGGFSGLGDEASVEQDASGTAHTAAEAAADADVTPPDPKPAADAASDVAMDAVAIAESQANGALAKKDAGELSGALEWGISGKGDGSYDAVLGGDYAGGIAGTGVLSGSKRVEQSVDIGSKAAAANDASAEAEATANGVLDTIGDLWKKLAVSMDLGLNGAASALGNVGMDIAGIFGFQQGAQVANVDNLDLTKHVDVAAPAFPMAKADLPEIQVPELALDHGGEVAMDAAAVAEGAIQP